MWPLVAELKGPRPAPQIPVRQCVTALPAALFVPFGWLIQKTLQQTYSCTMFASNLKLSCLSLGTFFFQENMMSKTLVEMTAEIIQSQISTKQMSTEEIKVALNDTFQTLKSLQDSETIGTEIGAEETSPVIDPKKSIQRNKIICLECGQEFKMLSPKHLKSHDLTARDYRKKYGFTARQPLCAKALSEKRSQSGKERGLPENLRKAIEARTKKK
ncbi:MAG: MucR family transcriptional regulator [Desulfobulbus sp.]|nr:MucR family transcriptional regulator [Desulfobulbus sp.]